MSSWSKGAMEEGPGGSESKRLTPDTTAVSLGCWGTRGRAQNWREGHKKSGSSGSFQTGFPSSVPSLPLGGLA